MATYRTAKTNAVLIPGAIYELAYRREKLEVCYDGMTDEPGTASRFYFNFIEIVSREDFQCYEFDGLLSVGSSADPVSLRLLVLPH